MSDGHPSGEVEGRIGGQYCDCDRQRDQSIVVKTSQSRAIDSVHIRPSACPTRVLTTTFSFGCSPNGEIARVMHIDPESNIETVRGVRFRTMFLKCGQEGPTLTWAASDICLQMKTFPQGHWEENVQV